MQEQHFVAEPTRLAHVVRHHHDLRSRRVHRHDDALDLVGRAGIEARGRLVEEQHLRVERPRARKREALLLAAREHARRMVGVARRARRGRARPDRAHAARVGSGTPEHFNA